MGLALLGVVIAFGPGLLRLAAAWWTNPEYSHGVLMPFVAAWIVRDRKKELLALRGHASWVAIPLLVACLVAMWSGQLDFLSSLSSFAFVGALASVVLAFLGWPGLRTLAPALVVLLLACPLPGRVQQALTLPLKEISSQIAVGLLHITGVPAYLEGVMIHLEGADGLWVADACSGIRSFISLLSVALIACLLWSRHWALKAAVVLAAIPIAILVNGLRIWLTGWLSVHVSPEAAEGAFHFFEGFALFAVAGALLLGFAMLLSALFSRADA